MSGESDRRLQRGGLPEVDPARELRIGRRAQWGDQPGELVVGGQYVAELVLRDDRPQQAACPGWVSALLGRSGEQGEGVDGDPPVAMLP